MSFRIDKDSMGDMKIDNANYWGAQTQRSFENFKIGDAKMPKQFIRAFAVLKRSAAVVNCDAGKLDKEIKEGIVKACDRIIAGEFDEHFPLVIYQTGSGTQTNMNLNEVIANIATEEMGGDFREKRLVHPNDHVNMSQSSNDAFPTAMHIAITLEIHDKLFPVMDNFVKTLEVKMEEFKSIVKIGRTHLQDAVPITLGQEVSGWLEMVKRSKKMIKEAHQYTHILAIGGTAVGTGLNVSTKDFDKLICKEISDYLKTEFKPTVNKFHGLTSHDDIVHVHGALKALSADMMKIANDVRWLAAGPRCSLNEINIPANEPGSSIMPGKVNPTQCEAVTMVTCRVMGNDMTISMAATQGNFELNVFKPIIIHSIMESIDILADSIKSFDENCMRGIVANVEKIDYYLKNSLMLVTALNPVIGYDNSAKIAKNAYSKNITLKESAIELNLLSAEEFDKHMIPSKLV